MAPMLEIDGSLGEGGGQVLRTSLSVAAVLGKKVRVYNIRAGRENPGLRPQHLAACRLVAKVCGGKLEGAVPGSSEIVFEPGQPKGGRYSFDIGTAGSVTLLLSAVLPVLLTAKVPSEISVRGGTHVSGAPTYDYFAAVFLPALAAFGAHATAEMKSCGFYPKGGGEAVMRVQPCNLSGHAFAKGKHGKIGYSIVCSNLPPHVPERQEGKIRAAFFGKEILGEAKSFQGLSAGNAVTLWSGNFGASCLGQQGRRAEEVALEACQSLALEISGSASVDSHLADQLLPYAALAEGRTSYSALRFSGHLKTNAEVLHRMTGRNIRLADEHGIEVF